MYFYSPRLNERISQACLYDYHGVSDGAAGESGWFRLDLTAPAYDKNLYALIDAGTIQASDGYAVDWQVIPRQLDVARKLLKGAVADIRFKVETGGVKANGVSLKTDRETQAALTTVKAYSDLYPDSLVDWKGQTGWVQVDRGTLLELVGCVFAHVQACFSMEKALCQAIDDADSVEALGGIVINSGWPFQGAES